jgi:hypothetical protein
LDSTEEQSRRVMEGRHLHLVLDLINEAIPDSHADLRISRDRLRRLLDSGSFGPPAQLRSEDLLKGLLRHTVDRLITRTPPETPVIALSVIEGERLQIRYTVRVVSPGPMMLLPYQALIDYDIGGRWLVATPTEGSLHFTTAELFAEFRDLDLRWTLRDAAGRCVRRLTDAAAAAWRSRAVTTRRRRWLSLYPSSTDRRKILTFLNHYGPRFLQYPPQASPPSMDWLERTRAIPDGPWAFLVGPNPGSLLARGGLREFFQYLRLPEFPSSADWFAPEHRAPPWAETLKRVAARRWAACGWDYFSEFNYQYQRFARTVRCLKDQPLPPPYQAPGEYNAQTEGVRQAMRALSEGLKGTTLHVHQVRDGTVVSSIGARGGLEACYAVLWETLPRYQARQQLCANPRCRQPFTPKRKDQTCCSTRCATAVRASKYRAKRVPSC